MPRRIHLVLLILATAASACSRDETPPSADRADARCEPLVHNEPAARRNVVFVLADTTRRDRVGLYGGPARTPRFDAFARAGVYFTAVATQAPWTKPSIATLFTGLLPDVHGVVSHPALRKDRRRIESDLLADRYETLAESLAAAGYQTAAFVSNPWLRRRLGFDQGFEVWDQSMAGNATPGEVVTAAGLRWLREREGDPRPFFLYLHYMDAHAPYHAVSSDALRRRQAQISGDTRPLTPRARQTIAKLARDERHRPLAAQGIEPSRALFELVYDAGVEHFDRALGPLLDGLSKRPEWGDTAVWITADHGEALFERGFKGHGYGLHGDETGVPLAARLPGVATRGPISCPVGLIDLRRTLCAYLGVECLGTDQGTSLFAPEIADPERVVVTEGVIGKPRNRAVRGRRYELLFEPDGRPASDPSPGGTIRFYDLASDPGESRDLLGSGLEGVARQAFRRLRAVAETSSAGPHGQAETTELDEATRRRLEALGYLDPAGGPPAEDPGE